MTRKSVLLFDVDGTLIRTGGAGSRALRAAFDELYSAPEAPGRVDVRGNTDGSIFVEALRHAGVAPTAEEVARVLGVYLDALVREVEASPGYEVLPGVAPCLDALQGIPDLALGLGTGNVEHGARVKLRRGGLDRYFGFGGFGCDSADRPALVRRGAERGATRLGAPLEALRVVVIGDTPRDVTAARANGFDVLAVATGGHPLDDLVASGADLAVSRLDDPRVVPFLVAP